MRFVMFLSDAVIPLLVFYILLYGLARKHNVYEEFLEGAKDGFHTVIQILPTLVGLMCAVGGAAGLGISGSSGVAVGAGDRLAAFSFRTGAGGDRENVFLLGGHGAGAGYLQGVRSGFLFRENRLHHGILHRDNLLHHVRLFYGGKDQKDPLDPGGSSAGDPGRNRRQCGIGRNDVIY